MNNGDMPASPVFSGDGFVTDAHSGALSGAGMGLTKREYFAAMAMQGILGNPFWNENAPFDEMSVARSAESYADALLEQLEQEQ